MNKRRTLITFMKIPLNTKKYIGRMITLSVMLLIFMLVIGNIIREIIADGYKKDMAIPLMCGSLLLLFCMTMLIHYAPLWRRRDAVIIFEDGILNDYTMLRRQARNVRIEDIELAWLGTKGRGISQIGLTIMKRGGKRNVVSDQLSGRDMYITDYMIDYAHLVELVNEINRQRKIPQQ